MGAIAAAAMGLISNVFGAIFKGKEVKAKLLETAIKSIENVDASHGQRETAIAAVIAAEAASGNRLASSWRPLLMVMFAGILLSFWFGYVPPHLEGPMPPMIAEIFFIIKLGIGGYIPARTLEKIVDQVNVGSYLRKLLDKRVG